MTFFSRSDSMWRTDSSCSWRRMNDAASTGTTASASSMKSPRWESFLLAHGSLEGHWLPGDLEDLPDLVPRDPQLSSDLLREGLAPQALGEVPVGPAKSVDEL
jgi:hypothetical protein